MGKVSNILLGITSGASFLLSSLSFLLQVASITYYAVDGQSNSPNVEYYILMAIPAAGSLSTVLLAALFFYDQVLMRCIREGNSKIYTTLTRACCKSCCLTIFNVTHKSLCLAYVVSSVATVGASLMGGVLSGAVVRGLANIHLKSESVSLWFSSMVVCCVFGIVSIIDSLMVMMRNYEKKVFTTMPITMSSQLMDNQSNAPYDYKN